MDKRRVYYFDNKNIRDHNSAKYNEKKFDQNFDELQASDVFKRSNLSQKGNAIISHPNNLVSSSNNTNVSYSNLNNFLLSGEYQNYQEQHLEEANKTANQMSLTMSVNDPTQSGFYSPRNQQLSPDSTNNNFRQTNLLSANLVNSLKDQYYKTKGYIENKPDILMDFVMDYRNFVKRGLKVPHRIQPFLEFHEEDIYYSLSYYNNEFLMSQSKIRSPSAGVRNKFKIKFTQDTLKRLYPGLKTESDTQKSFDNNIQNFDKFVAKLVSQYAKHYKEYINDETKIYDFWLGLSDEEKDLNALNWEGGEKNLELNLNNYFTNENLVKRLSKSFKRICGYECFHPRPLHDYWLKLISEEDKYLEGLYKYDTETLYKTLEEYYHEYKEQIKKAEDAKLKQSNLQGSIKNPSNKITKHKFETLKKRLTILAKPKDKWKTGRVMINLKRQFKYDNVIQKMIKYEFENNRIFKFPEEYALYDSENMRKTLFKNSLEKNIKKESEEGVKKLINEFVHDDETQFKLEEKRLKEIIKEDLNLEAYLKKMCIKYFHLSQRRLISDSNISINHFLSEMYASMLKLHLKATRRKFPKRKNYGAVKKSRFSNYPQSLKLYFFNLFRRIGINEKGKVIFANYDNMPFWAPSLSNKCKVHSNNCPPYCKNNSLNEVILNQKTKNFNTLFNLDKSQLEADERVNLWKRKDLLDQKSKIFLCLNEAEHCTFEPKINKKSDEVRQYTKDDIVNKRISNKVWVNKMGENFSNRFPLVFKEGVLKRVSLLLNEGKFSEVLKELEDAFDIEGIRCHFDKNYEKTYNKKKEENKMKNNNEPKNDIHSLFNQGENKKTPEKDDFNNSKNLAICREVYDMLKVIDNYKKSKLKAANSLKKELSIVKSLSVVSSDNNNVLINTYTNNPSSSDQNQIKTNTIQSKEDLEKTKYIKDRYFNFFKTLMCPLK